MQFECLSSALREPTGSAKPAQPFQSCGRPRHETGGGLASSATVGFEAQSFGDSQGKGL
jgi:hypothetical protein